MKIYNLKAAPVANVKELKDEKRPKAKQILLGADTHLRGYQVGRKVDHGAVGAVENFRSEEAFLLFVVKQRRKIACLAGMVPSEWSTGQKERRGSITKVGVPAIRRIIVEMVWRMVLFQPQYQPVQKWQGVLRGSNPALKKKAVVAIGRQLIVDLWRLETGRVTAQELNLVMIDAQGV